MARFFEVPVAGAALLAVPAVFMDEATLDKPWDTLAAIFNRTIWGVFLAEMVTARRGSSRSG